MASTATQVIEQDEQQRIVPGLQFDEPLSWRAGKPIPIADLLRKLQTLSKEMREMEQEENERDPLTKVAKELASPNLLAHKDKGVKAWTACCLVDILRLCAPDAPYTGKELRDIFTMLITVILPALSDPSNAYNNQHTYVLASLAQVKSIVLLTDIPSSDPLILHLFTSFFDILSGSSKTSVGEQLGKNVEINMTAILIILVDESTTLPSEVIDIIVAQFLRTDPRAFGAGTAKGKKNGAVPVADEKQSTLVLRDLPPAYNMAKTICNSSPEKMARHVSQYFNDVIVDASNSSSTNGHGKHRSHRRNSDNVDDSEDEAPSGPTDEDFKELYKAHQLLRELWRASPAVLQNVIPQLEAELSAENIQLRLLATETLGDIISGIGAAGLPPSPNMDPAAYPPIILSDTSNTPPSQNILTAPSSQISFPQSQARAYASFLGRKQDRSSVIRSAWTTAIGRILSTSAGGAGLVQYEEEQLIGDLARMLNDGDEKVRIAAVKVIGNFGFRDVILRLGSLGGVAESGSVLALLAERVRDRKHVVRVEAMRVLARIWGVGAGEIAAEDKRVVSIIGQAPSRILDTYYANDSEINALIDHAVFEVLLPLSYPPIKARGSRSINGNSQKIKDSQGTEENEAEIQDPDKIRTERILMLVKNLDEKSKKVFFSMQIRQTVQAKIVSIYLQRCEDFNGGVMDENETQIKEHLTRLIDSLAKTLPEPLKASADLWKFAKMHDRRSYQLVRFCMAADSDYRTMYKAFKEFTKRIEASASAPSGLLETLIPLLYRISSIVYNKSHVPAIMEYSRTDEKSLGGTAHEILREISSRRPEVLKAHVQEICRILQEEAPTAKKPNNPAAVDNLKACASFASKYAKEIPQDRKFVQAMTSFALHGTPPEAAKYAVSIIIAASDKKEILAKDLVHKSVQDFEYNGDGFLSRLATLSQLMLLAPSEADDESDAVIDIAIKQVLLQVRTPSTESSDAYSWSPSIDSECNAKCWALKILVNRLRSHPTPSTLPEVAAPVYNLLSTLIQNEGELSATKNTPPHHKSRLRLFAARLYLKLCTKKPHDTLLTPAAFNALALVAQDSKLEVRSAFLQRLKKYLAQSKLPQRFYTIPFLLAFEPSKALMLETMTWIRNRASYFSNLKSQIGSTGSAKANIVMESVLARLLSLLAHHPDYGASAEDLIDFSRYIIFYLQTVASEENLSLIYHIAQRVKQCHDAVLSPTTTTTDTNSTPFDSNLHHLSDLALLTIRKFEDAHTWTIQTLPAKIRLPTSLFSEIKDHDEAQRIAERDHLPEDVEEAIESLVRASMRPGKIGKKRRSDGEHEGRESKKAKASNATAGEVGGKTLPIRKAGAATKAAKSKVAKTPKKKAVEADVDVASSERRRSGRVKEVGEKSYAEREDEEDDEEMEELQEGSRGEVRHVDPMGEEEEEEAVEETEAVEKVGRGRPRKGARNIKGKVKAKTKHVLPRNKGDDEDGGEDEVLSDPPASDTES